MTGIRVLLVYPNQRSESLMPPAIAIFSAILKERGHIVELFDSTNYDLDADDYISTTYTKSRDDSKGAVQNLLARPYESRADALLKHESAVDGLTSMVTEFKPDLIAVTVTESTFLLATQLIKTIRSFEIPNIFGGVFTTFAPERALGFPEVDMVCVGEGENCLVDLCDKMSKGEDYSKVTNLWLKDKDGSIIKNSISNPVNVNEVPRGDFKIFEDGQLYRPMYGKLYRMMPVETHRGCPYQCSFCNSPAQSKLYSRETSGSFFRKRAMDKVYEDLVYFRDVMKMEYIYFWADTFFAWSEKEFDEFCEMYADIGLPFWCQTRIETIKENRIKTLKEIGLHLMGFGMEHGNEEFREKTVLRKYTNASAIEALKIPPKYDVPFTVNNIIGFPGETRELAFDTIELNRQFQSAQMSCSIFQPYSGTALRGMCEEAGYLHPDTLCPANSENTVMTLPNFTSEQLIGLKRTFAMYARFPKDRWPEIKLAEELTPEGDEVWTRLSEEFTQEFFATPEVDITEQGNPFEVETEGLTLQP
ncbi:MAG: B12-binding domain-containing radical SAM protein [Rhodospirillaceae bacterium]|jgi:anaerobic magnesium-protoporphyrin IX monomethyl ester cyclase|nr:B12-binding domain-containing radical SAM protein [Rhodospirillaceae bacterium]